jgi:hypothetical protein
VVEAGWLRKVEDVQKLTWVSEGKDEVQKKWPDVDSLPQNVVAGSVSEEVAKAVVSSKRKASIQGSALAGITYDLQRSDGFEETKTCSLWGLPRQATDAFLDELSAVEFKYSRIGFHFFRLGLSSELVLPSPLSRKCASPQDVLSDMNVRPTVWISRTEIEKVKQNLAGALRRALYQRSHRSTSREIRLSTGVRNSSFLLPVGSEIQGILARGDANQGPSFCGFGKLRQSEMKVVLETFAQHEQLFTLYFRLPGGSENRSIKRAPVYSAADPGYSEFETQWNSEMPKKCKSDKGSCFFGLVFRDAYTWTSNPTTWAASVWKPKTTITLVYKSSFFHNVNTDNSIDYGDALMRLEIRSANNQVQKIPLDGLLSHSEIKQHLMSSVDQVKNAKDIRFIYRRPRL